MTDSVRNLVEGILEQVPAGDIMRRVEREALSILMQRLGHNQHQVAHAMGLDRKRLRDRLIRHGIYDPTRLQKPGRRPRVKPHLSTLRT